MSGFKHEMNLLMGEKLKELRRKRGLTQNQLASELDTNPTYISSIERGERGVGPELLSRYCNFLSIKEEELTRFQQKEEETGYPPLIKMLIDELLDLQDYEQARLLADLKERKTKTKEVHSERGKP